MFEVFFIPAFNDNYIWLLVRDGRAAVVDPGDATPVIARLDALQLSRKRKRSWDLDHGDGRRRIDGLHGRSLGRGRCGAGSQHEAGD